MKRFFKRKLTKVMAFVMAMVMTLSIMPAIAAQAPPLGEPMLGATQVYANAHNISAANLTHVETYW